MDILGYILVGVAAYLIGSISPSMIISNSIAKKDIRNFGSGNAGTTNMLRTFGWKLGMLTLVLDVCKGILCVLLGRYVGGIWGIDALGATVGSVMAIVGHNWPVYYKFRGGKGIATTLGCMVMLMPIETLILTAVSVLIMAVTRFVSLGSIVGVVLEVAAVFIFRSDDVYLQIAIVIIALLALAGHRENIKRLAKGRENRMAFEEIKVVDNIGPEEGGDKAGKS